MNAIGDLNAMAVGEFGGEADCNVFLDSHLNITKFLDFDKIVGIRKFKGYYRPNICIIEPSL